MAASSRSGPHPETDDQFRRDAIWRVRLFYIQTRAFADYLILKSGRAAILADIAQAVANGDSVEAWLSDKGADYSLPASIIDLQHDWEQFAMLL